MVFDEIVNEVCEKLNLSSDEAKSRVARNINNRYRRITTSIGLDTSRYVQVSKAATIGNRTITFTGIEKVLGVIDKSSGVDIPLQQITLSEMHITPVKGDPPRKFAVLNMHATSVDIYIDTVPATAFTLYADGLSTVTTLSGSDRPDFPESFHDILIHGAIADEYRRMEKAQLMADAKAEFESRLSDLRLFIAKSTYLDNQQGKYVGRNFGWTRDNQLSWDD